jgi:hypothetical protein
MQQLQNIKESDSYFFCRIGMDCRNSPYQPALDDTRPIFIVKSSMDAHVSPQKAYPTFEK